MRIINGFIVSIICVFVIAMVLLFWGFTYNTTTSANTTANATLYSGYIETINSTPWLMLGILFALCAGSIFYAVHSRRDSYYG